MIIALYWYITYKLTLRIKCNQYCSNLRQISSNFLHWNEEHKSTINVTAKICDQMIFFVFAATHIRKFTNERISVSRKTIKDQIFTVQKPSLVS